MDWWREIETEKQAFIASHQEDASEVFRAKEREIQNLKDHKVFVLVEDTGQTMC